MTDAPTIPNQPPSGVWRRDCPGAHEAMARIERGFASADDLLLLGGHNIGMESLVHRSATVWPQLRCLATIHPELIPRFADWFRDRDRVQPYLRAAFEAIADEDIPNWKKYWGVVAQTHEPPDRADHFLDLLRSRRRDLTALTRPGRTALRHEAVRCLGEASPEVVPLLYPVDALECEEILNDDTLPPKWRGFALAATLKTSKSRMIPRDVSAAARSFLPRATADVLREYLLRAQHLLAEHHELWAAVVDSPLDRGFVIDRLLELGTAVPPERLHRMLASLKTLGFERLDLRFLKGDFSQAGEWRAIDRARQRAIQVGGADTFTPEMTAKLDAGLLIQKWMAQPQSPIPAHDLHAAFAHLGCPLPGTLRLIFRSAFGSPAVGRNMARVEHFAALFLALYPVDVDTQAAAAAWDSIVAKAPQPQRESLRGYFWTRMVPRVPAASKIERVPLLRHEPATLRAWKLEALLYAGIIAGVFLLLVAVLLIW